MTRDEMQLLRDFRREVPEPDDETVRRAYVYATSNSRTGFHEWLHWPRVPTLRLRFALPAAVVICAGIAGAVILTGNSGSSHTQRPVVGAVGSFGSGGMNLVPHPRLLPIFPPSRKISASDASATLGAPVVLPNTSLVQPSDVGQARAQGHCPYENAKPNSWSCQVFVSFPKQSLSILYSRPVPPGTPRWYGEWAKHATNGSVINLNGTPALEIQENAGSDKTQPNYPGWIEFASNGTRVIVAGYHDEATLRDVALSILSQLEAK